MPVDVREAGGQTIYTVTAGTGPLGFIVVDRAMAGRSRGGLRLLADVSEAEIRAAARSMTLKYGWLGLPQGGSKAGVRGDAEGPVDSRRERLVAFAREARALLRDRVYVPDADLGTSTADIRHMMAAVGLPTGPREWQQGRSGFYTAVSCLGAASAALASRGRSVRGTRVAVEGFGSVGSSLASLLAARGASIVAVSTSRGALYDPDGLDVASLTTLARAHGSAFVLDTPSAQRLDRSALLELDVDLLCPCARFHSIRIDNVDRVRAPIICPGANNPVSEDAEARLHARGQLVVPDFVANSGGVLGGTMDYAGLDGDEAARMIEAHVDARVRDLLSRASGDALPTRVATDEALRRFDRVREESEHPTLAGRLFSVALSAFRRGLVPRALARRVAPRYFRAKLGHSRTTDAVQ